MTFGERIYKERKKKKLSAQQLADACGLSRSYITLIENDHRRPGKKILGKLAEALGVKSSFMINWYLDDLRKKLE
jgi:transcriptional regulator with XRE-family HTH domain